MNAPILGILAGMGPSSTAPFLEMVYAQCRAQLKARHDGDFPKIVVCSQPAPFFHDRPIDHDAVAEATVDGLRTLERAGADVIAIACNSVHMYADRLRAAVRSAELLDIVDVALDGLPPSARRVAFCTSRPLTVSRLYPDRAAQRGLAVVDPPWQPDVDALQDLAQATADAAGLRAAWTRLFARLGTGPDQAVDSVVVACLDLSGTLATARAAAPVPLVDAAQALAVRLVERWKARAAA